MTKLPLNLLFTLKEELSQDHLEALSLKIESLLSSVLAEDPFFMKQISEELGIDINVFALDIDSTLTPAK